MRCTGVCNYFALVSVYDVFFYFATLSARASWMASISVPKYSADNVASLGGVTPPLPASPV